MTRLAELSRQLALRQEAARIRKQKQALEDGMLSDRASRRRAEEEERKAQNR
jgi:hypothetical protein